MIEIAFTPHDSLEFVTKLTQAEHEVPTNPLKKAITGEKTVLLEAFDLDELEEIAEYIQIYVKHRRAERTE